MRTPRAGIKRIPLLLSAGALALMLTLLAAAPALGAVLAGTQFTLDQKSGGKPARFTLVSVVASQPLDSLALTFPKELSLKDATLVVSSFDVPVGGSGNPVKVPVSFTSKIEGERISLTFSPAVAVGLELHVEIHQVLLPMAGGQYNVALEYVAGGVSGKTTTPPFSFKTLTTEEAISAWLDQQPWVEGWNSVKFFNIFFKPQMIVTAVPLLFTGWLMSIGLVAVAFPFAIAGGLLLAFAKMSKLWPVRFVANIYINVIRGTPLFLQIFVAFVGLPIAGLAGVPLFPTGVIVLALNSSAYLAEIFRAGIQSISKGQFEAASSLGMSYPQAMAFVIIPQTVKRVLPTMTSEFILLFKDTALLSAVGVFELMLYSNSIATRSGNLTPFMVAAVYYLVITIPLINWVTGLERKLAISEGGQAASVNAEGRKRRRWKSAPADSETEMQPSVAKHESR
jgi:polar amino acid transport system substrate-binding protein